MDPSTSPPPEQPPVPFRDALRVWIRVALLSFGGPAGQIAVMHRLVVEERRWLSENRFLHSLHYCMLLPGPEAQQLATYIGWLLHGWRGGLVAGLLFILPGFLAILVLSVLHAGFQGVAVVDALLFGLKPAVLAVVVEAVLRIGRRALRNGMLVALAAVAFVAIFCLALPFPLLIAGAAAVGLLLGRRWPERFAMAGHGGRREPHAVAAPAPVLADDLPNRVQPSTGRALRVGGLWLAIWLVPLAILALTLGPDHVFVATGTFFSEAAVVTFGGAYAVLTYVAQQAVEVHGWLQPGEMLDGLGMAETTPGPLIQVVQFVGFLAAYRDPGALDPMLAGVLGSVLVTWVTFAPCFLWIFLGAPYIEALRHNRALGHALAAITAAVVGAILNLAVWFALHTLFGHVDERHAVGIRLLIPDPTTLDPAAAVLAVAAFLALFRFKLGMLRTLGGAVVAGAAWHLMAR